MARTHISQKIKDAVVKRSNNCCEYCKVLRKFSTASFVCEHIIPVVEGGTNDLDNLANACMACNSSKYTAMFAFDAVTNQMAALFHPRKDDWHQHFKWSADLLKMEGLTPTGRATIIRLKTNRSESMNLRGVIIGKGHPPD